MFAIIPCTNCNKEGMFPIEYKLTVSVDSCTKCRHMESKVWTYYFCCSECFAKWYKKNKHHVECRDCNGTGWYGGFPTNGTCKTCKGSKIVENGKKL